MISHRRPAARRGAAAVEFVIVLPLILLFVLAIVDFGRFAFVAVTMDNSARVAAEWGATRAMTTYTQATWEANIKSRATEELADLRTGWLNDVTITVTTTTDASDLNRVTVSINGDFAPIVSWPFSSGLLTLRRDVSVRQFR